MDRVDLHVHTCFSDGSDEPALVLSKAKALGLRAVAITDHDCTDGLNAVPPEGLELIPGVELNVTADDREIHVLGYFIDPARLDIRERMERDRERRNQSILDLLRRDGINITLEELRAKKPVGNLGRPQIAQALADRGLFPDRSSAFRAWLGEGKPYYVRRGYLSPEEAGVLIRRAGGKAVLAHPMQYKLEEEALRALVRRCREAGFSGLEVRYTGYDGETQAHLTHLAGDFGLCVTGGSDYHGAHRPENPLGGMDVPYAWVEALREAD